MSKPAIQVKGISKSYKISHEMKANVGDVTMRDTIVRTLKKPVELLTGHVMKKEKFWALHDVSFDVQPGEVVGIIGKNGSGKSTLLKIMSRITEPTHGEIVMNGRVASLLEVGTGFHPELTGRENIYFNGSILGMKKKEIEAKFDEIVAFSEVEKFLDTPVKFYSSGMYVRLAFAVAAHLEPDILIVDEVLAVGDAAFQKKCLGKMQDVAGQGRTVLFVSHNMHSILQLCNRAVFLQRGELVSSGDVQEVTKDYYREIFGVKDISTTWEPAKVYVSNKYFRLNKVELLNNNGSLVEREIRSSQRINISISVDILEPNKDLNIGYMLVNSKGDVVYWSYQTDKAGYKKLEKGRYTLSSVLLTEQLNDDDYSIKIIGGIHFQEWLLSPEDSMVNLQFSMKNDDPNKSVYYDTTRPTILAPVLDWDVTKE